MSIAGAIGDKIMSEIDSKLTQMSMKKEAFENLSYSYNMGMDAMFDVTDNMTIENLQKLGIDSYENMLKISKLQEGTLGKYGGKLGSDITSKINTAATWVDSAIGWAEKANYMFVDEVYKRNLSTVPPSAIDKTIGLEDPVSSKVDLRQRVYNIVERCGYAQDRVLSIGYGRNYIFTSRPTLASDASGKYRSFVFFTRPNCNLISKLDNGKLVLVSQLVNYDSLFSLMSTDPKLYSELCRDGAEQSNLFRLLGNYCKEVPPIRLAETERSGIENMYQFSTPVPGVPEYHNVEVSLTFMDNYRGDIAKILYALSQYRHNVSKRGYSMRSEYIRNRADDTLMSMYIVTTTANMEIVGFGVALNGVITDVPSHFTQHRMEGFNKEELLDNFSVTMKFATYYPHCPKYFDYFNNIFEFNPLDVVDVKGSLHNMVAPGRSNDVETSGGSSRATLFGEDFGVKLTGFKDKVSGVLDTSQNYVDKIGNGLDKAKSLMMYSDSFNTAKGMLAPKDNEIANTFIENVNYNYKGQFEFLAKNPGVYTATSTNPLEAGRIIYKLGFSY